MVDAKSESFFTVVDERSSRLVDRFFVAGGSTSITTGGRILSNVRRYKVKIMKFEHNLSLWISDSLTRETFEPSFAFVVRL